jgi:pimeloyl-ACP methyl ester carboxylesterase
MSAPQMLDAATGRRIAYHRREAAGDGKGRPGVVFLTGFRSDMNGTKAAWLDERMAGAGRAYLRFDYSGHGESSGAFEDGAIGDWAEDAAEAVARLTEGPQVLVGSSLGGWIALLVARRSPERVAGLVGIAAAPDFTEDSMWAGFDAAQRRTLAAEGRVLLPSDYGEPLVVTRRLIEEGREHLVLREPLRLPFPVRLLHGGADADVPVGRGLALLDHMDCPDARLTVVKGADHRFSGPEELALIERAIDEVTARGGQESAQPSQTSSSGPPSP